METYKVKYGQSIFDVALQLYGDISGISNLLLNNPTLNMGSVLVVGNEINYDPNSAVNATTVSYFSNNNIVVANGEGYVYHKETSEPIKVLLFIEKDINEIQWKISGSGSLIVDWGDNSALQTIELSSDKADIYHSMDSFLSTNTDHRKIKFYGDFTISSLKTTGGYVEDIFVINNTTIEDLDISDNRSCSDISFLNIAQNTLSFQASNIKVGDLLPLIYQEKLTDLWIDNGAITQEALDSYFIGLVTNYQARPACNVRMWGNSSPSGTYQRPDELYNPLTGLEAMWVLENERGWSIQEIIEPPVEENIVRRFESKENSNIVDSFGNNAKLSLPVSLFDSSKSSYLIADIKATDLSYVSFKFLVDELPVSDEMLLGSHDSDTGNEIAIKLKTDGSLEFTHNGNSFISEVYSVGGSHLVVFDNTDNGGFKCFIDGNFLGQLTHQAGVIDTWLGIGCTNDKSNTKSDFITAAIWDININSNDYIIPLPHLAYNVVTESMCETNELSEGFVVGGSEHMLIYGAVAKRPNNLVTGYAEKIGSGPSAEFWSEQISGLGIFQQKRMTLAALVKVNETGSIDGLSSQIKCEFFNSSDTSLGASTISGNEQSYDSISTELLIPTDTDYCVVTALRDPSSLSTGVAYAKEIKLTQVVPKYIPNKLDGEELLPLVAGDTFIAGSEFLNTAPFRIDFGTGSTELEYMWDKSKTAVWASGARDSEFHDSAKSSSWHMADLNQRFIVDNIQSSYLHIPWVALSGTEYKDIFQYSEPITGDDKNRCDRYVHLTT